MPRMRLHNEDVLVLGLGRFGGAVATELHRLGNSGQVAGRILEVAFGTFDEDDIVRLEDDYQR